MNGLRLALGCLTILPLGPRHLPHELDFGGTWLWFPVIGLGIGGLLVGVDRIASSAWVLVAWILVSGALHLDGLGDFVDGLVGGRSREERLRIMKDPHVGAMAVVAITTLLIVKFASLTALSPTSRPAALWLAPCVGRYSMVFLGTTLPPARTDGVAAPFVRQARRSALLIATAITAAACMMARGLAGLWLVAFVLVIAVGLRALCARALGGVTGDALGAVGELTEVAGLCGVAWLG